jgi:hypothetical protein
MDEMRIDRRQFLRMSGGVAVASVLGSTLLLTVSDRVWGYDLKQLNGAQAEALLQMVRRLYPDADFDDSIYAGAVQALDQSAAGDAGVAAQLAQGVAGLDAKAGGSFATATPVAQTVMLREIQGTPFFNTVRGTAVFVIYNNSAVWAKVGYEGEAFSKGGYLNRGFNDVDWLPR